MKNYICKRRICRIFIDEKLIILHEKLADFLTDEHLHTQDKNDIMRLSENEYES